MLPLSLLTLDLAGNTSYDLERYSEGFPTSRFIGS